MMMSSVELLIVIGMTVGLVVAVIAISIKINNARSRKSSPRQLTGEGNSQVGGQKTFGLLDEELFEDEQPRKEVKPLLPTREELDVARTLGERAEAKAGKGASSSSWANKHFEGLFGDYKEIPKLSPLPLRTSALAAKITGSWFDHNEEDAPLEYAGECLIELTLDRHHKLYLGTGFIDEIVRDEDDDDDDDFDILQDAWFKGYGEVGCRDEPAARAWLSAFCSTLSSEVPFFRNVKRHESNSVSVYYFGIEKDGDREWHRLAYQATWVSDELIYVRLEREGNRAEVFLSCPAYKQPQCIYGWGELVLMLENQEDPAPVNDPQVIRAEPLIASSTQFSWHHENRHATYHKGGEALIVFDYGEDFEGPSELVMSRWTNMLEPDLERQLVSGYVPIATCSPDGRFALVIVREQEDPEQGAHELYVFDVDGSSETSFLLPRGWDEDTGAVFSPTGGEIALSLRDEHGRGWVRICDRVGNVLQESARIDGFFLLEQWSSRGIVANKAEGYESYDGYYGDRHRDPREHLCIWDHESPHSGWERLDLYGRPSPNGVYDFRPGPFEYRFFKDGEMISKRPARTGWDLQYVLHGDGEEMPWLHEKLFVITQEPWEIINVETGEVLPLVSDEIQNEYYSMLFLDSGIVFFVGTEQCSWAKVAIPEDFLEGGVQAAPGGTAW